METSLFEEITRAFRRGDARAADTALVWTLNRVSGLLAEGNRQRLTQLWKDLAGVHYDSERLDLTPELREHRGYLAALVDVTKAVRDLSDDLEAIEKVKKCIHGAKILAIIAKEGTIQHGELAERLNISAPSLTQAMRAIAESKTITATVHGKFKYYSLTPLGALVARKLGGEGTLAESIARMNRAVDSRLPEARAGLTDFFVLNAEGIVRTCGVQVKTSMYPSAAIRITPDPGSSRFDHIVSGGDSPSGGSPDVTGEEPADALPGLDMHQLARRRLREIQ